jgi:hypothetical protein
MKDHPLAPLTPQRLVTCIIINQLATPGLGSLMARRKAAGTGQLTLSLAGFVLIVTWMFMFFYGISLQEWNPSATPHTPAWLWQWGVLFFGASWLWSLGTSAALWRQARQTSPGGGSDVPPRISDYRDDVPPRI